MKISALEKGDPIEVIWNDSTSHENGDWIREADFLQDENNIKVRTVGIYLGGTVDMLKLCGDRYEGEDYERNVGRCFIIPIGCIDSVKVLHERREGCL